jgi:hypothetical protein
MYLLLTSLSLAGGDDAFCCRMPAAARRRYLYYVMQAAAPAGGAEDTKYRAIDGLTWFDLLENLAIVPKAEDGGEDCLYTY